MDSLVVSMGEEQLSAEHFDEQLTLATEISDVTVNVGPINYSVSQLFHLLNTKVYLM